MQISKADVWRRKSSHVKDSKQRVINIDISVWQLQTPKFLSVPPQQTQTNTHTHIQRETGAHTNTLLCQQKILSCVESSYSSKSNSRSSREKKNCHKRMQDLFSGTWLSRLVLLWLTVPHIRAKSSPDYKQMVFASWRWWRWCYKDVLTALEGSRMRIVTTCKAIYLQSVVITWQFFTWSLSELIKSLSSIQLISRSSTAALVSLRVTIATSWIWMMSGWQLNLINNCDRLGVIQCGACKWPNHLIARANHLLALM